MSINQLENGSAKVNINTGEKGNGADNVIAEAIRTFALQLPNTIQSSIRWGVIIIVFLLLCVSLVSNFIMYQQLSTANSNIEVLQDNMKKFEQGFNELQTTYNKINDRHQRMTQYAKEHDYRILTKEER